MRMGILRLTALALHGGFGAREALLRVLQRHLDRPLPLLLVELLLRHCRKYPSNMPKYRKISVKFA